MKAIIKGKLGHDDFTATVTYSEEDETFVGYLDDIKPNIFSFEGQTVPQLQEAFEEVIKEYKEYVSKHS